MADYVTGQSLHQKRQRQQVLGVKQVPRMWHQSREIEQTRTCLTNLPTLPDSFLAYVMRSSQTEPVEQATTGLYRIVPWDKYERETKSEESVVAWTRVSAVAPQVKEKT